MRSVAKPRSFAPRPTVRGPGPVVSFCARSDGRRFGEKMWGRSARLFSVLSEFCLRKPARDCSNAPAAVHKAPHSLPPRRSHPLRSSTLPFRFLFLSLRLLAPASPGFSSSLPLSHLVTPKCHPAPPSASAASRSISILIFPAKKCRHACDVLVVDRSMARFLPIAIRTCIVLATPVLRPLRFRSRTLSPAHLFPCFFCHRRCLSL